MFFGGQAPIARFDKQVHPIFEKLTVQQLGYMWRETEVDLTRDKPDFRALLPQEQHIFTSNLKRQILLDTEQGRTPSIALLPLVSLPELENWIQTWTFFETIHSRSYTHIIRNVYSDPSEVIDGILDIKEITDLRKSLAVYADDLIDYTRKYEMFGDAHGPTYVETNAYFDGCSPFDKEFNVDLTTLKKKLYLYLMSVNALEGVRFYSSFACSWAFAEQKSVMEGNAKIIKLICRDENLHLAAVQHILKLLPKEDPEFVDIIRDCQDEAVNIFETALTEERDWNKYLFSRGSMIGLNESMLNSFVESRTAKLMKSVGLPTGYKNVEVLPWTKKWISGSEVQVAPQETELTSYVGGGIKHDLTPDTFKGISL